MEEDSWENWLSNLDLGMNGNYASGSNLWHEGEYSKWNGMSMGTSSKQKPLLQEEEVEGSYLKSGSQERPPLALVEKMSSIRGEGGRGRGRGRGNIHHIMSERKRRREIAEKFVALSAIIPGLNKIDKSSILHEAINYVRQLQERITVLEKESNKSSTTTPKSLIITKSSLLCSATNSNETLPCEVVARGLEKDVFIRIHCEKHKGIMLKLLPLLKDIHLSVTRFSILPFGDSFLHIIIIAQMSMEYTLTLNDLVKNLKRDLLKLYDTQL